MPVIIGLVIRGTRCTENYILLTTVLELQEFPKADFKAAIFTYHFGYDNKGWPSKDRTARLFEHMGKYTFQSVLSKD